MLTVGTGAAHVFFENPSLVARTRLTGEFTATRPHTSRGRRGNASEENVIFDCGGSSVGLSCHSGSGTKVTKVPGGESRFFIGDADSTGEYGYTRDGSFSPEGKGNS